MARWLTPKSLATDPSSPGPQILAAGLWRCTTSSLQIGFEELFDPPFRPCMHGSCVLTSLRLLKLCVRASSETSKPKRQAMLRQIFTGYNASSDFPGMAFVDDLIEMYPDMRIVLNKRKSARDWEKSVNETLQFFSTWRYVLCCGLIPQCYWHWQMYRQYERLAKRRFGENVDIWSAEYYEMHNQWVRDAAKRHGRKVLEWEPSMGWKPLCEFLGAKVPQQDFPRLNDGAEINGLKPYIVKCGLLTWCAALTAVGVTRLTAWWLWL